MKPLEVTAHLRGPVALPNGPIALDALLAWAVCLRDGIARPADEADLVPIEIPLAREPGGRFHLASVSHGTAEARELRWTNRRFPIPEAQALAEPRFRRIDIKAGAQKSYRLPLEAIHFEGDRLMWWCIGERDAVAALLGLVSYLGKRRAVGIGQVAQWTVEPCEPWPGFPVVRDGQPLRSLPLDWPGLAAGVERAHRTLTYPYWRRSAEEICAVPRWSP